VHPSPPAPVPVRTAARRPLPLEVFALDFDGQQLAGPYLTREAALERGAVLATAGESGVIYEWNATPLQVDAEGLLELVARLRCRCGAMLLEPSPGCAWHASNAERARDARAHGSVEV
jgi:hypothetical protein